MAAGQKILLVDDEPAVTATLGPFLERTGFVVALAADGVEAMTELANFEPDLILLDVRMPRMNGRDFLRRLRQRGDWTPIILLTQFGLSADRTMALNEGADDYINKECDPNELVARIEAVLRRTRAGQPSLASGSVLVCGEIRLDRHANRIFLGTEELHLKPRAFELLVFMMTHPQELLTRERLLDVVWGWDTPLATRAVDARVAELRAALRDDHEEPRYIETVRALGYRFKGKVEVRE